MPTPKGSVTPSTVAELWTVLVTPPDDMPIRLEPPDGNGEIAYDDFEADVAGLVLYLRARP